jgi:alpha-L-rhamnosidase
VTSTGAPPVVVEPVTFEHHREALGIGEARPRISWRVRPENPEWGQRAYEIRVTGADGSSVTSGRIDGGNSVLVPWPVGALPARARRQVSVRVWGVDTNAPTGWSEPSPVETGLLAPGDWSASLISPGWTEDTSVDQPPTLLRRDFRTDGEIASARLYLTAHGLFEAELNGVRVGRDVLTPGWSSYRHRLRYHTYDVTDLLRTGDNAIGVTLSDGWFRGHIGFDGGLRNIYGEQLALLAQLEITDADGSVDVVVTDEDWRAGRGAILRSGIYPGETHDARREPTGWSAAGFDDSGWSKVESAPAPTGQLVAPSGPPVRRTQELRPTHVFSSPSGRTIADFGQNLVGRVRISVSGIAGTTLTLRHAEVLEHGELGTRPLRLAEATDRYILGGGGVETWEPRFTIHGFRYVEIDGWPGDLVPDDIRAVVLHSDMRRTGWFSCSDEMLNRLHENVLWSMRGNFVDLPTDCPQRDERLGWTGDIQVFAPTAAFLYDCTGMLTSWLADLAAEQVELGTVPVYVPYVRSQFPLAPVAAWGDAAVVVPWVLYQRTGDADLLGTQYSSMRAWVDQIDRAAGPMHVWDSGFQLGDWLDPAAPPDRPADARTDRSLVATAYLAHSAGLLARTADILGNTGDHLHYAALADATRAAFRREYVSPSGRLVSDAPTALALALVFDLLEPEQRETAGRRLVALVKAADHRVATGFVGTPIICDALCDVGAHDTAYHLLTQTRCPSWLYPVGMGATTIWERWDSMLPDGSINPGDMTSFNHYALGAVADWMHRTVAGLAPAEPGYRTLRVAPRPGGGLTHAAAAHETPYGRAEVAWTRTGDELQVVVLVPPGATAVVELPEPSWGTSRVGPGRHEFTCRFRPAEDDPAIPVDHPFAEMLDA